MAAFGRRRCMLWGPRCRCVVYLGQALSTDWLGTSTNSLHLLHLYMLLNCVEICLVVFARWIHGHDRNWMPRLSHVAIDHLWLLLADMDAGWVSNLRLIKPVIFESAHHFLFHFMRNINARAIDGRVSVSIHVVLRDRCFISSHDCRLRHLHRVRSFFVDTDIARHLWSREAALDIASGRIFHIRLGADFYLFSLNLILLLQHL